jgi:16S rRNA (cytosine967-C5)-methyltransferase
VTAAPRAGSRDVAAQVLARVLKDRSFASAALESELEREARLEPRDRALATELVYGSLRTAPWLLEQVAHFAPRGIDAIDPTVRAHLVVSAYQLFFTRVPAFAAVNEAVESVTLARSKRMGAFVNAVLRKVAARAAEHRPGDTIEEAVVASAPAWLRQALERALSDEGARAFLACGAKPPAVALRVERASEREAWITRLEAARPEATIEPGSVSPHAILIRGAGKPQRLPGWDEGALAVQEEGSQAAALALGARDGDEVLDACAGRGNKAAMLARAVEPMGVVDACDSSPTKLERLATELARLGLKVRARFAVDWTVGSGEVERLYDRVLVDAPCTGVGTLRRRPEIALHRDQTDLKAITAKQVAIASRAASHVRPGGTLVYVVCSVLREEAEEVIEGLTALQADLRPAPFESPAARALAGEAATVRLLPHVHGTDGYFLAHLRRSP